MSNLFNRLYFKKLMTGIHCLLVAALIMQPVTFVFAETAPSNVGHVRHALYLPKGIAEIESIYRSTSDDKMLYLIQDAHTNPSAQLNIFKTIQEIQRQTNANTVFIEASFGDSSLGFLRGFASPKQLYQIGLAYLKKGMMQGSELSSLASNSIHLWGAEDPQFYDRSIHVYREVKSSQVNSLAHLKYMQRTADDLKERMLNPHLLKFDQMRELFRLSEINFGEYLSFLEMQADKLAVDLSGYASIERYYALRQEESSVDFDAAGHQQAAIFRVILQSQDPQFEDIKIFLSSNGTQDPKTIDEDSFPGFYYAVEDFINHSTKELKGVETEEYARYLKYMQTVHRIRIAGAVEELSQLEEDLQHQLIQNKSEEDLLRADQALKSIHQLILLQLTPNQFQRMLDQPSAYDVVLLSGFLNRCIFELDALHDRVIRVDQKVRRDIARAMEFYELTLKRDEALVENTLRKMNSEGEAQSILVAGGFHAPNIQNILKRENISYTVIQPQVMHETNHHLYERLLIQGLPIQNTFSAVASSIAQPSNAGIRALTYGLKPLENPQQLEEPLIFRITDDISGLSSAKSSAEDMRLQTRRVLDARKNWAINVAASRLSIDNSVIRIFFDTDGIPKSYSVFEVPEFGEDAVQTADNYIDFTGKSGLRKAAELLTILPSAPDYDSLILSLGDSEITRKYIVMLRELREEYSDFFDRGKVTRLKVRSQNQAFSAFLVTEQLDPGAGVEPRQLIYVVNTTPYGNFNKQNAVILPPSTNSALQVDPRFNFQLRDVKPSYRSGKHNETVYFRRGQKIHEDGIHIALFPFWSNQRSSQMMFVEKTDSNRLNFYIHQDHTKVSGVKKLRGAPDAPEARWEQPLTIKAGQTVIIRSTLHLSFPQDHPDAIQSMSAKDVERRVNAVLITDRRGREERIPIKLRRDASGADQPDGDSFVYEAELHIPYPGLYQAEVVFSIPGDQLDQVTVVRSGTRDASQAGFKDVVYLGDGESETKASIVALTTNQDRYFDAGRRTEIAKRLVPKILGETENATEDRTPKVLEQVIFDMLGSIVRSGGVMASPDLRFDFENIDAVEGNPAYGYVWIRDAASFGSALIELYEETQDPDIHQAIEAFRAYIYRATELTGQIDAQRFDVSGEHVPPTSWGHQTDGPGHITQFLLRYLKTFHVEDNADSSTDRDQAIELLQKTTEYIVNYAQNAHYYVTTLKFLDGNAENDPRAHDYWEVMYGMNLTTDIHFYSVLQELKSALDPQNGYLKNDFLSALTEQKLRHTKGLTALEAIADILNIYERDDHNQPSRHLRSQRHVGNYERFAREKPKGIDGVVIGALTMVDHPRYFFDHTKVLATYNVIDAAYQTDEYNLEDSEFWSALKRKFPLASIWWRHPGDDYNGLFLKAGFGKPTGKGNPWHISIDWPVQYNNRLLNFWLDAKGLYVRDEDHLRELSEYLMRQGVDVGALNLKPNSIISTEDQRFKQIARALYDRIDQTLELQENLIPNGKSAAEQIDAVTGNQRGATALTWSNWQLVLAQLNKRQLKDRLIEAGLFIQSGARLATQTNIADQKIESFVLKAIASDSSLTQEASSANGALVVLSDNQDEARLITLRVSDRQLQWSAYPYLPSFSRDDLDTDLVIQRSVLASGFVDDRKERVLQFQATSESSRLDIASDQLQLRSLLQDSLRSADEFLASFNSGAEIPIHYEVPVNVFRIEENRNFDKQIAWMISSMNRIRQRVGENATFEFRGLEQLYQFHFESNLRQYSDPVRAEKFAQSRQRVLLDIAAKYPEFIYTEPISKPNRVRIFLPTLGELKTKAVINIAVDVINDQSIPDFYSLFGAAKGLTHDLTLGGMREGFLSAEHRDISSKTLDFVNRRVSEPFKTTAHLFDYTVSDGIQISLDDLHKHRWKLLLIAPFGREIQTLQTMLYAIGTSA